MRPKANTRPCISSTAYELPLRAPVTCRFLPATITWKCSASLVSNTDSLHSLPLHKSTNPLRLDDDFTPLLELDFATLEDDVALELELDLITLEDDVILELELDLITLEDDVILELELDLIALEDDIALELELDFASLEEDVSSGL